MNFRGYYKNPESEGDTGLLTIVINDRLKEMLPEDAWIRAVRLAHGLLDADDELIRLEINPDANTEPDGWDVKAAIIS